MTARIETKRTGKRGLTGKPMLALCALLAAAAVSAQPTPTGHQLFIGPAVAGPPPQAVPFAPETITAYGAALPVTVYLHRADDAGPAHPPALSFDLVWNPAVLAVTAGPGVATATPLVQEWYDKQVTVNFNQAASGRLSISVAGGVTFDPDTFDAFSTEITTYDNQLPVIGPETGAARQNPFPVLTVQFAVVGNEDDTTPLAFEGAILSDQEGFALPNQSALNTTVVIAGDAFPPLPPGSPVAAPLALAVLSAALLGLALRSLPTARNQGD